MLCEPEANRLQIGTPGKPAGEQSVQPFVHLVGYGIKSDTT